MYSLLLSYHVILPSFTSSTVAEVISENQKPDLGLYALNLDSPLNLIPALSLGDGRPCIKVGTEVVCLY